MADPVNLLGLALRAGKTVRGDALLPAIAAGKIRLAVIQADMGANRKKKIMDKCKTYQVPLLELPVEQYERIGPKAGAALGITDRGFADAIEQAAGAHM